MARDLNQAEAAEALGKSIETIRRWRRIGEGPTYRIVGSSIRYPSTAIDDFLRAQIRIPCAGGSRSLSLIEASA